MSHIVAVIGSGPSGVIAARILVAAGVNVDMYDIGTDLSYQNQSSGSVRRAGLIPQKTLFGSTYMYCRRDGMRITASDNVSFDTSHAKGGLSNVWGATVGAVTAQDISDWPVSIEELSHHLKNVFDYLQLSAREDMIDSIYPTKLSGNDLNYENIQSAFILQEANRNAAELLKQGIVLGKSKLAINNTPGSTNSCILCGQCMTGCERGAIFNSWTTVQTLKEQPGFRYFDRQLVHRFEERGQIVELTVSELPNRTQRKECYRSVILAAGCIDSTKIVDASLDWTGYKYRIQDSQKFYFPVWISKGGSSTNNKTISLAHLYVQAFDSYGNVVQGQLYPGQLIATTILEHLFGGFGRLIEALIKPLLNRFFVGVAYFSSSVSGQIEIQFSNDNQMTACGTANEQSNNEFKTYISKLIKSRKLTGFVPLFRIKLKSKLGHSQHFGGTIPMKAKPVKYESDRLGRPFGCQNVFIVDSTVLTSIPATPTTGLAMANSARIASSVVKILNSPL